MTDEAQAVEEYAARLNEREQLVFNMPGVGFIATTLQCRSRLLVLRVRPAELLIPLAAFYDPNRDWDSIRIRKLALEAREVLWGRGRDESPWFVGWAYVLPGQELDALIGRYGYLMNVARAVQASLARKPRTPRAGQAMNPSGGAVDDAPAPYGLAQTTTPSPDGHTAGKADQQPTTGARASGPAGPLE